MTGAWSAEATDTGILEMGPGTVRRLWPELVVCADREAVSAALGEFDDPVVLVGDLPVGVASLWRRIAEPLCGPALRSLVAVHPSWWSKRRVEQLIEGFGLVGQRNVTVVAMSRAQFFAGAKAWWPADVATVLIEIGPGLIAMSDDTGLVAVLDRATEVDCIVDMALRCGGTSVTVLVDAPDGVPGADDLAEKLCKVLSDKTLSGNGVRAMLLRMDQVVAQTMNARAADPPRTGGGIPRKLSRARVVAAASAAAVLCAGGVAAARSGSNRQAESAGTDDSVLVAEGRIAVRIPLGWNVENVTGGPGSRRIRATSSDSDGVAVHVTQSYVPGQTLDATAEALEHALAAEAPDVFRDFEAHGSRVGRPTVTYREVRGRRVVDWFVVLDGSTRIGIGCESLSDREGDVLVACDDAIESAHELQGTDAVK